MKGFCGAIFFGLFLLTGHPAQAAEQAHAFTYMVTSVVCQSADDNGAHQNRAIIDIQPGENHRTACPDGTRYVGHYTGDEFIEVMSGIPVPPPEGQTDEAQSNKR